MATNPAASPTVSSTIGLKNMVIAPLVTDTEEGHDEPGLQPLSVYFPDTYQKSGAY